MTVTTAQATSLLENVLFESPTLAAANATQWVNLSATNAADSTVAGMAAALANSAEAGIAEQVVRYYEGALGRVPAASEIGFYVKIAEAGLSPSQAAEGVSAVPTATWSQIAGYFAASPEFQALTSGGNVIPALYQNILGRTPAADEVSFYQKALDGGTTVSTLLQYFVNSTEYQSKMNGGIATLLAGDGQAAVNQLGSGADPVIDSNGSMFGVGAGAVTISLAGSVTTTTGYSSSGLTVFHPPATPTTGWTTATIASLGSDAATATTVIVAAPTSPLVHHDSAPIELVGVSASDISLLPAHS